jgi:hypothetical protein
MTGSIPAAESAKAVEIACERVRFQSVTRVIGRTARWALVDLRAPGRYRLCVGQATGEPASGALGLRQQRIELVEQLAGILGRLNDRLVADRAV